MERQRLVAARGALSSVALSTGLLFAGLALARRLPA